MILRRRITHRKALRLLLWASLGLILLFAVVILFRMSPFSNRDILGTTFNLEIASENDDSNTSYIENRIHSFSNRYRFSIKDEGTLTSTQIQCRFSTCFDFPSCKSGFRVFTPIPTPSDIKDRIRSPVYLKILMSIRQSAYYTSDPSHACMYVLAADTIDRDHLSKDFVSKIDKKVRKGDFWNRQGKNVIVFNLFAGKWPDYSENLAFDHGFAVVARASFSDEKLRRGYDVSFPLFQKDHPQISRADPYDGIVFPLERKYLIAFKGKRYLVGIGSEVRDELHIIHNGKDVILLTTCKHGKGWEKLADSRCKSDIEQFERYSYF